MSKEFTLPELGENVTSGTIATVFIKEGDTITANQAVLEIETDKAVVEIPSPFGGKVTSLKVKDGQTIKVGDTVFVAEEDTSSEKDTKPEDSKKLPDESEKQDTAKVSAEGRQEAPKLKVLDKPEEAPSEDGETAEKLTDTSDSTADASPKPRKGPVLASPSVRRLAREKGVDLKDIPLADPNGPITAQDVLNYAEGVSSKDKAASSSGAKSSDKTVSAAQQERRVSGKSTAIKGDLETYDDRFGLIAVEPMNAVRRKTAAHMEHCWSTIPHVNHFEKVDITALETLRKQHAKKFEAQGGKLTITCFIMKVVAEALQRFPRFNATIDIENDQMLLKQYYHIGVAVDTENGLLVPVIRDVDKKSITDLTIELPEIAQRARDRKLELKEMQGATFTISNLGGLGVSSFTPIINSPEVAIMGVSRASIEPVFLNGQFVPRTMLPISISYDHRAIDGADAARFMRWVVTALEQPWLMWLEE